MRCRLLFALLIAGCNPVGQVYTVRRPEIAVEVPCSDTGSGCDQIQIFGVAFEREASEEFVISNAGARVLTVDLQLGHADFSVEPSSSSVAAGSSETFTVSYAPTVFDDQEASLLILHNAVSDEVVIAVLGTTDPDADGDGYFHELAPGGNDCNDFNASVNPGTDETWYDGIDQDCDGHSDYDMDRDGYDIHTRPDGDDCEDDDADIHPGAPDPPKDGIDQDCDGDDG